MRDCGPCAGAFGDGLGGSPDESFRRRYRPNMSVPAHTEPLSAPGDDVLLRPGEVSRLLGVDPKTLTRWADSGRLPAVVLPSGHRRYRFGEVRAVLHPAKAS